MPVPDLTPAQKCAQEAECEEQLHCAASEACLTSLVHSRPCCVAMQCLHTQVQCSYGLPLGPDNVHQQPQEVLHPLRWRGPAFTAVYLRANASP